ncbi:hypothetical protein HQ535_00890 [bacterium]|nr:hypothetical protein [bacterium]
MARLFVEGWAPEYGASVEPIDALSPTEGSVDVSVEDRPWDPVPGVDDGVERIAFVDGIRRVDARLVLDRDDGPVPGICGSYGVGATLWDRTVPRSEVIEARIERIAVLGSGHTATVPPAGPALTYRTESVADDDPASLVRHFHGAMRLAEATLTERLAGDGVFVVADGPLYEQATPADKVGFVKSHRVSYLPGKHGSIISALSPGERTPVFTIRGYERYSWYVCLARYPGGHSWTGIARLEAPAALPLDTVVRLADRTAAVLPLVASEPHLDPRAPQNLVPIGALERELRRRLGEPGYVLRCLRAAVMGAAA